MTLWRGDPLSVQSDQRTYTAVGSQGVSEWKFGMTAFLTLFLGVVAVVFVVRAFLYD